MESANIGLNHVTFIFKNGQNRFLGYYCRRNDSNDLNNNVLQRKNIVKVSVNIILLNNLTKII